MNRVTATSTGTSDKTGSASSNGGVQVPAAHIAEQSISAFVLVEVITDVETDEVTLCIASDMQLTDYRAAAVSDATALARQLREKADQIEALADEYAEKIAIPAFIGQYSIELEELDTASLLEDAPDLAAAFRAFSAVKNDGSIIVAVPKGQGPVERLAAIRDLVLDLQKPASA